MYGTSPNKPFFVTQFRGMCPWAYMKLNDDIDSFTEPILKPSNICDSITAITVTN